MNKMFLCFIILITITICGCSTTTDPKFKEDAENCFNKNMEVIQCLKSKGYYQDVKLP